MEWWGFVEGVSVLLVVIGALSVLVAIGLARMTGLSRSHAGPGTPHEDDPARPGGSSRDALDRAMAHARGTGRPLAILCIDLDQARRVSEALEPEARVALLETLARRLRGYVRAGDRVTRGPSHDGVAGGAGTGSDRLVLLLGDLTARQDAVGVARRMLEELARPVAAGGRSVSITASAGIALYPGDGDDADTLLARAEQALRHAQSQGPGSCTFYPDAASTEVLEGLRVRTELDRAIDGHEARLYGEPGGHVPGVLGADAPARS